LRDRLTDAYRQIGVHTGRVTKLLAIADEIIEFEQVICCSA
jgi:hypothetical protein